MLEGTAARAAAQLVVLITVTAAVATAIMLTAFAAILIALG